MSLVWAGKCHPVCGVEKGAPGMLCSFRSGCIQSRTGTGALAWKGLSWQEGAWLSCEVGAPIPWASLGQARRQVRTKGWRWEEASPRSPARRTHIPPRFGVNHPRERLGAVPWVLQAGPPSSRGLYGGDGAVHLQVGRVLPIPAPSEGCAAFCISSSHCHSNRLGAWVPAMPAPASRTAILPAALTAGPQALLARHGEAGTSQRGVSAALAPGDGCLQCHASIPSRGPAWAHPRGLGGSREPCLLLSHQKITSAETSSQ